MTPILVLGMRVPVPVAVGTDLVYSTVTKLAALSFYWRRGRVRWRLAGWMLTGSLPAGALALAVIWRMRSDASGLATLMSAALAAALALSAGTILLHERLRGDGDSATAAEASHAREPRKMLIGAGAAVGALVSMSSVGAGALGVAALMLVCSTLEVDEVIGTDLAHGVVLAAAASAGHTLIGNLDFALLANLLLGMVPGVYLGGRVVGRLPQALLRRTISLLLLGVAVRLIA